MTFNLITTPWLEVRRASGARVIIRPIDITSDFTHDPIIALDFPRPDWNAALTEFLIGITYLAFAPQDVEEWAELFRNPPPPTEFAEKLADYIPAFDFNGEGARAYQDFESLEKLENKPISGLLIEAPGEQTLKNNADLFIKRGGVQALSLPYAAAALITLQTYAPSGGAGHRTSLRGGGPLTTLVKPRRVDQKTTNLWDIVWANVPPFDDEKGIPRPQAALPWLSQTKTSEKNQIVTADNSHPALAFFACPRRIRLDFTTEGACSLSSDTTGISHYRTQNYGASYDKWLHPLSPYRDDKKSGKLPLHPNAGASDYGDWLAWWGFQGNAAAVVQTWEERRTHIKNLVARGTQMAAFGFDMDNMKARQWLNASLPWLPLYENGMLVNDALKITIEKLINGTNAAARALVYQTKIALFGQKTKEGGYKLPDTLSKEAFKETGERLWQETQPAFEGLLKELLDLLEKHPDAQTTPLKQRWLDTLRRQTLQIFEETVDVEGLMVENPRRVLYARDKLSLAFIATSAKGELMKALELQPESTAGKEAA